MREIEFNVTLNSNDQDVGYALERIIGSAMRKQKKKELNLYPLNTKNEGFY